MPRRGGDPLGGSETQSGLAARKSLYFLRQLHCQNSSFIYFCINIIRVWQTRRGQLISPEGEYNAEMWMPWTFTGCRRRRSLWYATIAAKQGVPRSQDMKFA